MHPAALESSASELHAGAETHASSGAFDAALVRSVPWLAGALPLAYYVATASPYGGFFEEGSFVAAARQLGVAHAPGAPIQTLLAAGFALLPIGPLPFRVAIASALCVALTLSLFASALLSTMRHVGVAEGRSAALVALAASLWLGQTPLFMAQATRPQVFAVQYALSMLILYTLLRFEEEEPHGSTRVLYFGAFLQGLCFANHHVYGLLMLPAAAPTLGRVFARRGFIGLMGYMVAPLLGFSVYLYVPFRLAHAPESGLAGLGGVARTLVMLGAEPYAGPSWASPLPALPSLLSGLGSFRTGSLLTLAALLLLGAWLSLRSSHRRRFGTLWLITLLVPLASVQWVLCPRVLEDAWGALLPSALALTALLACAAAAFSAQVALLSPRVAELSSLGLVALALFLLVAREPTAARAMNRVADEADELWRRQLTPDAVLFISEESSSFWQAGREAEEALRADLTRVPLSLQKRPHALEAWAEQMPELADTLRALVLSNALDSASLQSLSALRPVYVEPSQSLPRALRETTLDEGLWLRVRSEGVTSRDLRDAEAHKAGRVARLDQLLRLLPANALVRESIARALQDAEPAP